MNDDLLSDGEQKGKSERTYTFRRTTHCNMCGTSTHQSEVVGLRLDQSQGRNPRSKRGVAVSVCRCRSCGLLFADPLPTPASIEDHYGLPPASYWQNVSFRPAPGYFARQVSVAKTLLGFSAGMRSIDIGLGLGKAALVMRDAGFDVHGIEPSPPFYAKAIDLLGGDQERFQLSSLEDAQFAERSFDFVTFGAVLEHLYDPSAAITKAMTWLKPGGVVHCEVPSAQHLVSKLINGFYRTLGTNFVTNISPMHVPYHLYEFTLDAFHRHGVRHDYELAAHWYDVGTIRHIPSFLHPALRALMKHSDTGLQLTVFLRKLR